MNARQKRQQIVTAPPVINTAPQPRGGAATQQQQQPQPKRKRRFWRKCFCCIVLLTLTGIIARPYAEPYILAAADPIHRARLSVEKVHAAEKKLANRLDAIRSTFKKDYQNKLENFTETVANFDEIEHQLRLIGNWLLQEGPRVQTDMDRYVKPLETAAPRLREAATTYNEMAKAYPEDTEFFKHYVQMSENCMQTATAVELRVQFIKIERGKLDKELQYVRDVLLFLDRFDLYLDIRSVVRTEEGKRIDEYLAALASFRKNFDETLRLLGQLHGGIETPAAAGFENAEIDL